MAFIPGLLGAGKLDGLHALTRRIGPARAAIGVDVSDPTNALRAVQQACQLWGGAASLLLPRSEDGLTKGPPWDEFIANSSIDLLIGITTDEYPRALHHFLLGGSRNSLLPALAAMKDDTRRLAPTVSTSVPDGSEWEYAYAASLGQWPTLADTTNFNVYELRDDVTFEDFLPTDRESVESPSAEDLLARLRDATRLNPVLATSLNLERVSRTGSLDSGEGEPIPRPYPVPRAVGPNTVVLYEPDSVEDLCLAWNLRWCWGLPHGAPLAVPITADVESSIRQWMSGYAFAGFTLSGSYFALTSVSVPDSVLKQLASRLGEPWRYVRPEDLILRTQRASRASSDVGSFLDGSVTIPTWSEVDRGLLPAGRRVDVAVHMNVSIEVQDCPIPEAIEWDPQTLSYIYRDGAFETGASRPNTLAHLAWPSGWEVLERAAADRGLVVRPSQSGLVASSLVTRLGSVTALNGLASPTAMDVLYDLSERKGSIRFRRQIRDLSARVATDAEGVEAKLDAIIDAVGRMMLPASEDERDSITFDGLEQRFGSRELGRNWLAWAEAGGLILRGVELKCDTCNETSWGALADLGPTMTCRWCGASIAKPFGDRDVVFRYVASAHLLSVMGHDALPHLLAMRWFDQLFVGMSGRGGLIGCYPGVELADATGGETIGEADVLLLLSTGDLVPGECKLRSRGMTEVELEKLEVLAERLDSPWTFIATPESATDCAPEWRSYRIDRPARPRMVLSGDHLFAHRIVWLLGADPFEWTEWSAEEREVEAVSYGNSLEWMLGR